MAMIGWGKPRIFRKELDNPAATWEEFATPAEGSTALSTTKGDKTEAKIEGGANEDVKYGNNTYALTFNLRAAKGRPRPIEDFDGVITKGYAIALQPEDPTVQGFVMENTKASVEDSFSAADGGVWAYTFDALVPKDGQSAFEATARKQVQWGVVGFADGKVTLDGKDVAPNPTA